MPDNYVDALAADSGTLVYKDQSDTGRVVSYYHAGYRTIISSVIYGATQGSNRDRLMSAYIRFLLTGGGIEQSDKSELGRFLPYISTPVRSSSAILHLNPRILGSSNPSLSIYDASGRLILQSAVSNLQSEVSLDVRSLRPGAYLCRITTNTAAHTLPFTIIR